MGIRLKAGSLQAGTPKTSKPESNEQKLDLPRTSKYRTTSYWASIGWSIARAVLVSGICFLIVHPLLVKISSSLMTEADLYDLSVKWFPRKLSFQSIARNYQMLYHEMNYGVALINSLLLAFLVAFLQLISCSVIGYGFARFKYFGSNFVFALVILTLLVPPQMIMVPLFLNFRFFDLFGLIKTPLNLLGTYWPFVLTSLTGMGLKNGLFIYVMRQVFSGQPKSLEEAALVDGAGQIRTFFTIMLPGAKSALLIVFLFSFVWQYNDYYLTSMYLRNTSMLLPFKLDGLTQIFDVYEYSKEYVTIVNNTGMLMFIAPLLVFYTFLQRYFVESIERTGIVG